MVNALFAQCSDGGLTSDDVDVFHAAETALHTPLAPLMSSGVALAETRYYNVPATAVPFGDPAFVRTRSSYFFAGSLAATLPPQCAISITFETDVRRRWGRMYLGGLVSACMDNGRVANSVLTTIGNAIDTWGTTLRGSGQGLVVWSRQLWTPLDVQSFRVDDVFDVIRRRRFDHAYNRYTGSFVS